MLRELGLGSNIHTWASQHIFSPIINPGEIYGYLREDIRQEVGLSDIPVIAVASHDTASAVAGTPLQ